MIGSLFFNNTDQQFVLREALVHDFYCRICAIYVLMTKIPNASCICFPILAGYGLCKFTSSITLYPLIPVWAPLLTRFKAFAYFCLKLCFTFVFRNCHIFAYFQVVHMLIIVVIVAVFSRKLMTSCFYFYVAFYIPSQNCYWVTLMHSVHILDKSIVINPISCQSEFYFCFELWQILAFT